jgi:hypothetical protein
VRFNLAGVLLAGSAWLLAAVVVWLAGHPTAAVVLLAAQAALYAVIAVRGATAGHPTIHVQVRRRDQR